MKKEEVIRLIVIDDSSNDAETVSNILRNAGHAVRADRAEDDEDLREALKTHQWDMVLSKLEIPFFSAIDAITVIKQMEMGDDLPLLVIDDGGKESMALEALQAGARDVIDLNQSKRLVHAILREMDSVQNRRRQRECELQLDQANARAQTLVDSSRDSIAYVHEGMHIYANESYLQMFGYSDLAEIEGMPLMNMVTVDDHDSFKKFLRDYAKGKTEENTLAVHGLRADTSNFNLTMEFSPANYDGEQCTQIIIRDQSVSKELEEKLDSLSKQDLLTGVYNRQYFLQVLGQLCGRSGEQGAVLYIASDKYKQLRDDMGIGAADLFLTDFANVLDNQLEDERDFVARLEGHVFTIILHDLEVEQAEARAQKVLKAVEEYIYDISGQTITTTCSIGIGLYNEGIKEPQEVLQRADRAHRRAADEGGNRACVYNPAAEEMAEQERIAVWAQKVKHALRQNQFRLLYQPIVSLKGDDSENYEVLLRMLNDDGEVIPPSEFMPAAAKSGLMTAVDRWVLVHAVKTAAERHRGGKRINFFVKLSAESLRDARLLPWLRDLLNASKLEANTLTLEVDEAVASSNLKALKILSAGLKQLHIRMAIDHFGRADNYANLLNHFDAEFLKVSGTLIGALKDSPDARARVQQITSQAQDIGKLIIAEYVEDADTLAQLYSSGVDYIQGNFLQAPDSGLNYEFGGE